MLKRWDSIDKGQEVLEKSSKCFVTRCGSNPPVYRDDAMKLCY